MSMTVEMILRLIDQATGPLRGVENEVERLQKAAEKLNAQRTNGGVKASVWYEQQQALRQAREEAERYEKTIAKVNAAQSAAMSAAAARGIERVSTAVFRGGVKAGVAGEHSEVSLETQGNTVAQIAEIQREAAELSRHYRAFTKTQIETMLGDTQSRVGSLEHAIAAMPELLQLRAIQQGMHGTSSDKEFGYLAKALEQGGVANDAIKLRDRVDTFARWMEVYRETFSVNEINEFYRGLKGPIARSLSEGFLRGTAGHFIQELGGHATGNALTQLYQAVVAGRAQPKALVAFQELGLLDMDKVVEGGAAGIRYAEPGAIKGWQLFKSDPDKWITDVLAPALAKFSGERREELEAALFSDQTARNIADKILNQQAVIAKDRGFIERAPGLEAWRTWTEKDPGMAATGASSQLQNLMRDAAKPYVPGVTKFLNWLSDLETKLGALAEQHPAATAAAGVGAVFAGWTAAAALGRHALIKGGEAWAEGAARATAGATAGAAGGGLLKGLFKGGLTGLALGALWDQRDRIEAAIRDTTPERVRAEVDAVHAAFGHRPGEAASSVFERMRRLHYDAPIPSFAQAHIDGEGRYFGVDAPTSIGAARPIPTFALLHGAPGDGAAPTDGRAAGPHVDTHEIDDAIAKARDAGEQIRQSLDVTASPNVDATSIEAFVAKAREAITLLGQLDRMGDSLRRGGLGAHALHDGPEAH